MRDSATPIAEPELPKPRVKLSTSDCSGGEGGLAFVVDLVKVEKAYFDDNDRNDDGRCAAHPR